MKKRYIALIPAYEPDEKMLRLIDELIAKGFEIVVVDDGSGADYEDVFEKAEQKAIVLTHEINKGKGAALKTGMNYIYKYMAYSETSLTSSGGIRSSGKDSVIVTVDADGQHSPEDALRIARIAEAKRNALILGSREFTGDVPARSMMGNTITRHVYRLATGLDVRDTQTGLRSFGRDMIPELLEIEGERYEYEINVLLKLAKEGRSIIEEDIETVYIEGNKSSHFNTLRDSFKIYREIIRFSASSLASFAIDYTLYALLILITGHAGISNGLIISNIGARVVSAAANYGINRKFVFKSGKSVPKSAIQYFILAAIILAGNTMVLGALAGGLGMNRMAAKIVTEIIFFMISWTAQKYVIFYREETEDDKKTQGNDRISDGAHSVYDICGT